MATALPLALISLARIAQCATQGILIGKKRRVPMDPLCASIFQPWQHSNKRSFALHRAHAPLLRMAHNETQSTQASHHDDLPSLVANASMMGLFSKLCTHHKKQRLQLFLAVATPEVQMCFPSILSPLVSSPLTLHCRTRQCNRLKDDILVPLLQRKLRLPVLPAALVDTLCPCHTQTPQALGAFGDNTFSCNGIVETQFHNTLVTPSTSSANS